MKKIAAIILIFVISVHFYGYYVIISTIIYNTIPKTVQNYYIFFI